MYRLLSWSVGTAAVVVLAMMACGRSEKLPKPTTDSAGRGSALAETGGTTAATKPAASPATTTGSGSAAGPSAMPPASAASTGGSTAMPAPTPPAPTESGLPVAAAERAFITEATTSSLAEIDACRMMAARSADPGIKSYARQMEREHLSANDELKRIAEGKGIAVPTSASKETRDLLERLRGLPSGEGDRAFVREFGIGSHYKAIEVFEKEAREGQDPQLRSFAEQTLPRLREHLTMAQQLQSKVAAH